MTHAFPTLPASDSPSPRATQHGKSAHHAAPCAMRGAEAALASRHLADSGHCSPFATALSSMCNKNIIPCADPSRRDAPPHGAHMNTSIFRTTALALSTLLFVAACQPSGNQAQTGEANAPGANAPADAGDKIAANITGAGATFIFPLISKWSADYNAATGNKVNYQSIGSGGGIAQIKAG